jgi:ubiquinone/menaquinone biosynthesis C-methylase UbiE
MVFMEFEMEGEERFGWFTSRIYAFFAKSADGLSMYSFVVDDILSSRKARKIIDIGTGPGNVPSMIAERAGRLEIYAVDPSREMLEIAKRAAGGRRIVFGHGYSQYIPFRTRFDIIFSSVSFHHWAHKRESLIYLSKFLSKGGEIRIYEFKKVKHLLFQEEHSMTREEFREAAGGTGLRVKEIIERKGKLRVTYVKAD